MLNKLRLFSGLIFFLLLFWLSFAHIAQANIFIFNHNLEYGNFGQDVKELQKYLNNNNFPLSSSGFGSKGNETTFFGRLTKAALIKFQEAHGIVPLWGFLGPITRAIINKIIPQQNSISHNITPLVSKTTPAVSNGYSIGGSITGISKSVTLQNNNSDDLTINPGDNSNFTFLTRLADGAAYNVSIKQNDSTQKCYLRGNIGLVNKTNVTSVQVACGLNLGANPFTTVIGSTSSSPALVPFVCGDTLVDSRDDQSYTTKQIGTQCWMTQNLNFGQRVDGSTNQASASNTSAEKYCYNNDPAKCLSDGALYQWHTAMAFPQTCNNHLNTSPCVENNPHQGICPSGWHLPTFSELQILADNGDPGCSLDCDAGACNCVSVGGKLKASTTHLPIAWDGTDDYNFSLIPSGIRNMDGTFTRYGVSVNLWSATLEDITRSWFASFFSAGNEFGLPSNTMYGGLNVRNFGYSVRCIKN